MTPEQTTNCIGLLLSIAFDSRTDQFIAKVIKGFVATLPAEEVNAAATSGKDFTVYAE